MEFNDLFNSFVNKSKEYLNNPNQNQNWNQNNAQNPMIQAVQQLNWDYNQSIQTLTTMDVYLAEQSLSNATNAFRYIEANLSTNDSLPYKIMFKQIDVTVNFVRSLNLFNEERFQKALESLRHADEICDKALEAFKSLHHSFRTNPNFSYMLPVLQNYFYYFDLMLDGNKLLIETEIAKAENKFVDEHQVYLKIAEGFKKVNSIQFEQDAMQLGMLFTKKINLFARQLELKAERLEEKRKIIQYMRPYDKKVFIVHGHNHNVLGELESMLRDTFHLDPIILTKKSDNGNTIIEKFEHYAKECAFAFVIVTPDDAVENNGKQYFQGRPNVLFELGWFCGRYGRNKVRILKQRNTELPSDLNGLVNINFQDSLQEVFQRIYVDLIDAGIVEK